MRDNKALKAAHILKKYCKRHKCENCIFHEHEGRMPCVLNITPQFYKLLNQDKMIYHGQEQDGDTDD